MKKTVVMYNSNQQNEITEFICENIGRGEGVILHEIESEYVYTDLQVITPENEEKIYVTFGMGARAMNAPIAALERTELIMTASADFDALGEEGIIAANELISLSKFPFRNDTWFGPGHTIEVSERFKKTFGYDAIVFLNSHLSANITGVGKVNFIVAVPIYAEEREWMIENGSFEYLDLLYDKFGDAALVVDMKRSRFIPTGD